MKHMTTPLTLEQVQELKAGDCKIKSFIMSVQHLQNLIRFLAVVVQQQLAEWMPMLLL